MKPKKIILALYIGIIALSSIGLSFSAAWYASATQLFVNSIYVNIRAERELKISTTDVFENAKERLSYDELDHPGLFKPVTSAYSYKWMETKNDKPSFYDDTMSYSSGSIVSTQLARNGYYSQELYLFADDNVYVTIDPELTFIKAINNIAYAQETYNRIQEITDPKDPDYNLKYLTVDQILERLNELVKAMRFSILVPDQDAYDYVVIDPNKSEETYLGGILDNDIDRYYDWYTVDGIAYEKVYGDIIDREKLVYDPASDEDSELVNPTTEANAFNAKHKAGVKRFNFEASKEQIRIEQSHTLDEFSEEKRLETPLNIPVYQDKANKIVLSIYIEGWDLDSVNYTMGASFDAGLGFQIAREM